MGHPGSRLSWGWELASPGHPGPAPCLGLKASLEAQRQPCLFPGQQRQNLEVLGLSWLCLPLTWARYVGSKVLFPPL